VEVLLQDLVAEGVRTLFLICGPCLLAVALAGLLSGILQTVTAIHESALSYVFKLVALLGLVGIFFIPMRDGLVALFVRALKG
jgi:flagellar biosynthesis protein FliQ